MKKKLIFPSSQRKSCKKWRNGLREVKAEFEAQAEAAAASYEQPYTPDPIFSSRAARNYSISAGSIAIQDGTKSGTIKITQGSSVANNLNPGDTPITITGTSDKNYVVVATSANRTVNLALTSVNMNNINATAIASCISLSNMSVVNLTLNGSNRIFAQQGGAGIEVPEGAKLTIAGTGTLTVTGGALAAAIGGYSGNGNCGNITINSGTFNVDHYALDSDGVNYGGGGAGIGGGYLGGCGTIQVNGGKITVDTLAIGAGIGGGLSGAGGNVTIAGGVLQSMSQNTFIGAGYLGTVNSVNINGGTITSSQSGNGAAIGSYANGNVNAIKISKGTINVAASPGAGIGAGMDGGCGSIVITGGDITAKSYSGAGIGGGDPYDQSTYKGICGSINISNATVNASGYYGAGIGGGSDYGEIGNSVSSITIASGTVTAVSEYASAIGGGYVTSGSGSDGTISIGSSANVVGISGKTAGAINQSSETASVLNMRFDTTLPLSQKAMLKTSNGNTVYTMGTYPNIYGYGSIGLTVPSGNYSLYVDGQKQYGLKNGVISDIFSTTQGITTTYKNISSNPTTGNAYGDMGWNYFFESFSNISCEFEGYANHCAFDLNAPEGTPIYNVTEGTVASAFVDLSTENGKKVGYGLALLTENTDPKTGKKLHATYMHMIERPKLANGENIGTGDHLPEAVLIGKVGNTGNSTGPHLHFDVSNDGTWHGGTKPANHINPRLFFPNISITTTYTEQDECSAFGYDPNYFLDVAYIDYVGQEEFDKWVNTSDKTEYGKTVSDFKSYFNINEEIDFGIMGK